MGYERDLELLRQIASAVSQLALAVTNAINKKAYDLNAAAFSETTNIATDYILDHVELNFSTAEVKTITVTSADGTIIWGGGLDTSASNLGYNTTKQNFLIPFGRGFNASENITVAVTQFSSPGTMDCVLKVTQGSNTLVGDPPVQGLDTVVNGNYVLPLDRSGIALATITSEHIRIHKGQGYTCSGKKTGLSSGANFDILLSNPAANFPHLRIYSFESNVSPADVLLYEAPSTSGGDACTVSNLNRNSANTADMTIKTEPTVTDVGDEIEFDYLGGSKQAGGSQENATLEWMLKTNTDYLIRFTAGGNNTDLGWFIFFYEG